MAMKLWPRRCGMERRILARLIKTGKPDAAVRAVDEKLRRLWVSALQSRLFNDVVARRIETLDQLIDGDLAYKHENGACFRVEDAAVEQPRCDALRDQPDRPARRLPHDAAGRRAAGDRRQVFSDAGLTPGLPAAGRERAKGARRPLRVKPKDVETRRRRGRVRAVHHGRLHPARRLIRDRAAARVDEVPRGHRPHR